MKPVTAPPATSAVIAATSLRDIILDFLICPEEFSASAAFRYPVRKKRMVKEIPALRTSLKSTPSSNLTSTALCRWLDSICNLKIPYSKICTSKETWGTSLPLDDILWWEEAVAREEGSRIFNPLAEMKKSGRSYFLMDTRSNQNWRGYAYGCFSLSVVPPTRENILEALKWNDKKTAQTFIERGDWDYLDPYCAGRYMARGTLDYPGTPLRSLEYLINHIPLEKLEISVGADRSLNLEEALILAPFLEEDAISKLVDDILFHLAQKEASRLSDDIHVTIAIEIARRSFQGKTPVSKDEYYYVLRELLAHGKVLAEDVLYLAAEEPVVENLAIISMISCALSETKMREKRLLPAVVQRDDRKLGPSQPTKSEERTSALSVRRGPPGMAFQLPEGTYVNRGATCPPRGATCPPPPLYHHSYFQHFCMTDSCCR